MTTVATAPRKRLQNGEALQPMRRYLSLPVAQRAATEPDGDESAAAPQNTAPVGLDIAARTLQLSFSSEEPVERWFGQEVLSHAGGAADLSRLNDGAPLLFNHNCNDVIGVVERAWVGDDQRGYALVRFARTPRGDEVLGMVADGVLRNVSFMYRVGRYVIESESEDPYFDDDAIYTAAQWMAYEVSIVSVPADQSVGVGRSQSSQECSVTVEFSTRAAKPLPQVRGESAHKEENMTTTTTTADPAADTLKTERERVDALVALGRKHDIGIDKIHEFIQRGISLAEARGLVLDGILEKSAKPAADFGATWSPDLTKSEKAKYSYLRALQAQVSKDWSKAGFEREVSATIAQHMGKSTEGFFIPGDLPFCPSEEHLRAWQMMSTQGRVHLRAPYLVGTAGQGGNLVQTSLLYENFIEVLRNQLVTAILGARYLTGLVGNIDIPRQITQTGTYWVAEAGAPTEAEGTFDKVSLRPKTIGALSKMSRLMLLQATPSIEMLARQDLLAVLALAIDLAACSGSGSSNQPTGIVNQSGVGSVVGGTNGANLTFDHLIQLKYATKFANAPQGAAAFAMNSKTVGYLSTLKASTGSYLWDPQGGLTAGSPDRVKGSPYAESQQLRSTLTKGSSSGICSELIYGNWQELFIGMWGVTEIMLNPYDATGFTTGDVLVRAFQTCDIGVRHGASFAVMSDGLTPGF